MPARSREGENEAGAEPARAAAAFSEPGLGTPAPGLTRGTAAEHGAALARLPGDGARRALLRQIAGGYGNRHAARAVAARSGAPRVLARLVATEDDRARLKRIATRAKGQTGFKSEGHHLIWELIHVYCPEKAGRLSGSGYKSGLTGFRLDAGSGIEAGDDVVDRVANGQADAVGDELRKALDAVPAAASAPARAAAPVAPESAADRQTREAIQLQFGVTVLAGDKGWSGEDLVDLRDALGMLSARERTFLTGFSLFRFSTKEARNARFLNTITTDHSALTELSNDVPPTTARISVFDEAFGRARVLESGTKAMKTTGHGGVNLGVYVLLHEFGHTIESSGRFPATIMAAFERLLLRATQPITNAPQSRGTDAREKYCEGFARFHADRDGLREHNAAIVNFFARGQHLP